MSGVRVEYTVYASSDVSEEGYGFCMVLSAEDRLSGLLLMVVSP